MATPRSTARSSGRRSRSSASSLSGGAEIDAVNELGWTPLRMAKGIFYSNTGKRFPEMEALLLELGADDTLATGPDNTIDWAADGAER